VSTAVTVCEAMTTLKQYEQALPGMDLMVQVRYTQTSYVEGRIETAERTVVVPATGLVWGTRGAVVVAEAVP
jgi:hypothetical protein